MSFSTGQLTGAGKDFSVEYQFQQGHEREEHILAIIKSFVEEELAKEIGGHLAVTIQGHLNDYEGGVGDGINLQVNSILPPPKPAQDAGLEAAGGSARNFPPEASTAAPATEDNSPPASQEPIPQPPAPGELEQKDEVFTEPPVSGVPDVNALPPTPDVSSDTESDAEPEQEASSGASGSTSSVDPSQEDPSAPESDMAPPIPAQDLSSPEPIPPASSDSDEKQDMTVEVQTDENGRGELPLLGGAKADAFSNASVSPSGKVEFVDASDETSGPYVQVVVTEAPANSTVEVSYYTAPE